MEATLLNWSSCAAGSSVGKHSHAGMRVWGFLAFEQRSQLPPLILQKKGAPATPSPRKSYYRALPWSENPLYSK